MSQLSAMSSHCFKVLYEAHNLVCQIDRASEGDHADTHSALEDCRLSGIVAAHFGILAFFVACCEFMKTREIAR